MIETKQHLLILSTLALRSLLNHVPQLLRIIDSYGKQIAQILMSYSSDASQILLDTLVR